MSRLIDADAYADKMRNKQNECRCLIDEAKSEEERHYWSGIFTTFVEAKLTLDDAPTVDAEPTWHSINEKPESGSSVIVTDKDRRIFGCEYKNPSDDEESGFGYEVHHCDHSNCVEGIWETWWEPIEDVVWWMYTPKYPYDKEDY